MPSPKKPGHTGLLVQVPDVTHAAADARRRREGVTWAKLVATLLDRWAAGDDAALPKAVKGGRPATPDAAEAERLHQRWKLENPAYARACTEKVDSSKLPRYRSFGELLAAQARRAGRTVAPEAVAAIDADDAEEANDG